MRSYGIIFSPDAERDLFEIREFYMVRNPVAAQKLLAQISGSINMLSLFPELGPVNDLATGTRYHVMRGYRLYYRPDHGSETIDILRVYDTRRDPKGARL
jgi:plasmid stabilization system protein ParE